MRFLETRKLKEDEVQIISDMADFIYSADLKESFLCFKKKYDFFSEGFIGLYEKDELLGYIIGHPWKGSEPVPLDFTGDFPTDCDVFYIHDVALIPEERGHSSSMSLIWTILAVGRQYNFKKFMLIAVNDTSKYIFEHYGFKVIEEIVYGNDVKSYKMIMEQ